MITFLNIEDLEAPKFNGCQNISEKAQPGVGTAMVAWTDPSATDNSGFVPNVICHPQSGNNFTIGATVVKCNATDNSGNTAQCSFDVTVNGMHVVLFRYVRIHHVHIFF